MNTITLAGAQEIIRRQAAVLGGAWTASTGVDNAWGVGRYPYAELSDGRDVSIRIWVNGPEAILSAEVATEFDEANAEIWGFKEEIVEAVVVELARGHFDVHERYVQVKAGRTRVRLTKWPPGSKVPGIAR